MTIAIKLVLTALLIFIGSVVLLSMGAVCYSLDQKYPKLYAKAEQVLKWTLTASLPAMLLLSIYSVWNL